MSDTKSASEALVEAMELNGDETQPQLQRGTSTPLLPGAEIDGKYIVEQALKQGGMGHLFLVRHIATGEQYALKAIPNMNDSRTTVGPRFRKEIEILSRLKHPHIVSLREFGETEALLYYVMDLLPGGSLFERLANDGPLQPTEALTISMDISRAIHFTHEHALLHRDLKPENVLFAGDRRPVLIDFGVAFDNADASVRITQKGHIVGTPFYMPPERFIGNEEITAQSDIYGLGLLLYEMIVGFNPFTKEKPPDAIMMIAEGKLPPLKTLAPDAPEEIEEICSKATHRNVSRRFNTAKEFTTACGAVLRKLLLFS